MLLSSNGNYRTPASSCFIKLITNNFCRMFNTDLPGVWKFLQPFQTNIRRLWLISGLSQVLLVLVLVTRLSLVPGWDLLDNLEGFHVSSSPDCNTRVLSHLTWHQASSGDTADKFSEEILLYFYWVLLNDLTSHLPTFSQNNQPTAPSTSVEV